MTSKSTAAAVAPRDAAARRGASERFLPVDRARVAILRAEIRRGTYRIDALVIAARLLDAGRLRP